MGPFSEHIRTIEMTGRLQAEELAGKLELHRLIRAAKASAPSRGWRILPRFQRALPLGRPELVCTTDRCEMGTPRPLTR